MGLTGWIIGIGIVLLLYVVGTAKDSTSEGVVDRLKEIVEEAKDLADGQDTIQVDDKTLTLVGKPTMQQETDCTNNEQCNQLEQCNDDCICINGGCYM